MRKLVGQISIAGPQGKDGVGVPTGGTTGQVLAKKTNADYDTEWVNGGSGDVSYFTVIDGKLNMVYEETV